MAEAYEVSAVLALVDRASPQLERILALAKDVSAAFERIKFLGEGLFAGTGINAFTKKMGELDPALARVSGEMDRMRDATIVGLGKMNEALDVGLARTRALAEEMAKVAVAARAMAASAGGRGGGHGGGGAHGGLRANMPIVPGVHGHVGVGVAGASAVALGYGIYEQAQLEDAVSKILFTAGEGAGSKSYQQQRAGLEKSILSIYQQTGMPLSSIEEAVLGSIRQMAPFPLAQREAILGKVLPVAAMETRLKGGDLAGNAESIIGLLHMSGFYKPDEINRLLPAFTYASLYDPQNVQQMVKAAGYAVPSLRTLTGVDPVDTFNMVALLQSAGISSTKAGTWIEGGVERLMPNTVNLTSHAARVHMQALRAFGLIDVNGKSTIMGPHGILEGKALALISSHLQSMPIAERAGLLTELGMRQGSRFLALASDPTVMARSQGLLAGAASYGKRQDEFWAQYESTSPMQKARVTLADFNAALMNVANDALPAATKALDALDWVLKKINSISTPSLRNAAQVGEMATVPAATVGGIWGLKTLWRLGRSALRSGASTVAEAAAPAAAAAATAGAAPALVGAGTLAAAVAGAYAAGAYVQRGLESGAPIVGVDPNTGVPIFGTGKAPPPPAGDGGGWGLMGQAIARAVSDAISKLHVMMDGQVVGQIVTDHQAKDAHKPPSSTSDFDSRLSPLFPTTAY